MVVLGTENHELNVKSEVQFHHNSSRSFALFLSVCFASIFSICIKYLSFSFNDMKISRTFICFVLLVRARPTGDAFNNKADAADDDKVELEKSNILLMGPTGSGNYCVSIVHFNSCL